MAEGPDHPIARELRAARAYSGRSRTQVANEIGISSVTLGNWERGDFTRLPAQPMLSAVAHATDAPTAFEFVTVAPAKSSIAERARLAAQRLGDTPGASPGTGDAQGDEGAGP